MSNQPNKNYVPLVLFDGCLQCDRLTNEMDNFSIHFRGSSLPSAQYNLRERARNKRTAMGKRIERWSPLFVTNAVLQPLGK